MSSPVLFRKKPIIIEAFRYGIDNRPDWFCDAVTNGTVITFASPNLYNNDDNLSHCLLLTLEGPMRGNYGDYIIKGIKGELYPCKPDIFLATYEPVAFEDSGHYSLPEPHRSYAIWHKGCECKARI